MVSRKSGLEIFQNGKFTLTLFNDSLSKGLRSKVSNIRNNDGMELLQSLVGKDGVLQAIDDISCIDIGTITATFPYPQIYVLSNFILLFTSTQIYELNNTTWELKLTTSAKELWQVVDFITYLYISNNEVAVIRNSLTQEYSISSLPAANALCNYNGQVLIGGEK